MTESFACPRSRLHACIADRGACICASAVLLATAVFKGHEILTSPRLMLVPSERWLRVAVVGFEAALAAWLLAGFARRWSRRLAVVTFTAFAAASFWFALSGSNSCGCFGRLRVDPWITFALDAAMVAILWPWKAFRSGSASGAPRGGFPARFVKIVVVAALCGGFAVFCGAVLRLRPATGADVEGFWREGETIVLQPEKWIGSDFPLAGHTALGPALLSGAWTVLFFHHDCPRCLAALGEYERRARAGGHGPQARLAFIEIPPLGRTPRAAHAGIEQTSLAPALEWFVETPCEIRLLDGRVLSAAVVDGPGERALATVARRGTP